MAGQDIAMNAFQIVTDADYVYVEKGNNQGKITVGDLKQQMGIYRINTTIPAGGQIEIPYSSGLIMIQDASTNLIKAIAILQSNNSGTVIVPAVSINFFSEVDNSICVKNTGDNTKYIVKNTYTISKTVVLTYIN